MSIGSSIGSRLPFTIPACPPRARSKGGTNSIMFAARHPAEVPKIVNLAGRFRTREGTLARFGADILERLAAEKGGIPRKEAWGEWVMTEQVRLFPHRRLWLLLCLAGCKSRQLHLAGCNLSRG